MLITPRVYSAAQTPDKGLKLSRRTEYCRFSPFAGWHATGLARVRQREEMLLINQSGSLHVGEVAR